MAILKLVAGHPPTVFLEEFGLIDVSKVAWSRVGKIITQMKLCVLGLAKKLIFKWFSESGCRF